MLRPQKEVTWMMGMKTFKVSHSVSYNTSLQLRLATMNRSFYVVKVITLL